MSKTQLYILYTLLISSTLIFNACSSSDGSKETRTVPIKQTGQTASYDENGTLISDGSLKDDGYYRDGTEPDYTRASEIVTDRLTGLMWQDDVNVTNNSRQWLTSDNFDACDNNQSSPACFDTSGDTAATYCGELLLGGYSDWRLPSVKELMTLTDYSHGDPFIDTVFVNTAQPTYWSSTTAFQDDNYTAHYVRFKDAFTSYDDKTNEYNIRCVRAQ